MLRNWKKIEKKTKKKCETTDTGTLGDFVATVISLHPLEASKMNFIFFSAKNSDSTENSDSMANNFFEKLGEYWGSNPHLAP